MSGFDPYDPSSPDNDPSAETFVGSDGVTRDGNGNVISARPASPTTTTSSGGGTSAADDDPFNAGAVNKITVPQNIAEWIREAAAGDPDLARITAAVIYQRMRWGTNRNPITPDLVAKFVGTMKQKAVRDEQTGPGDPLSRPAKPDWSQVAGSLYGNGDPNFAAQIGSTVFTGTGPDRLFATPAAAATATIDDVYSLMQSYFGQDPDPGEAEKYVGQTIKGLQAALSADPRADFWRKNATAIKSAKRWADSIYMDYTGKVPTNEQLKEIIDRGYTPDTLTTYLGNRPMGSGTVGQFKDAVASADKSAQQYLGRRSDPGEVNFMVSNGITTPDKIDAFYNQMKQRVDTGDPSFAWAGNPAQWRDMQSQVTSLWKRSGLTGEVDPHLVNEAITGGWSTDDIQQRIDSMPAPGIQGATVGEVNRIRPIADQWKATWYPTEKASTPELQHFVGGKFDSNQIHDYYGNMPSTTAPAPGPAKNLGSISDPGHLERVKPQDNSVVPAQGVA